MIVLHGLFQNREQKISGNTDCHCHRLAVKLLSRAIELSGESQFVFPQNGNPNKSIHKDSPATALERGLKRREDGLRLIDVDRFTPHDLRRTMISHCEDTLEIDEMICRATCESCFC